MNTGLDILFFERNKPGISYRGQLYLDVEDRDFLEFSTDFKVKQFDGIDVLYATDVHSNEIYTLVNCAFNSFNFITFRYRINESYKGAHLAKAFNKDFYAVETRMTYLTQWINHPRFRTKVSSSIYAPGDITIKEEFIAAFDLAENMFMELHEFCGEMIERQEVHLRTIGYIKFVSKTATSRLELYKNVSAFQKLLSFFTDRFPKLQT
jgi:hypothetical protein